MSTGSTAGIQRHVSTFMVNCAWDGLWPCGVKTLAFVLGKLLSPLPPIHMGDTLLKYTETYDDVGFKLRWTHENMFAHHFKAKTSKAHRVANTICSP
ncbi:hypothetical protein PENSPDRAFT_695437 [Peniophora sp. CONT]|nr:hypothetical protein PENSPDRAFT_695437 [Peniophora sp. CONT]